MLINEQFEGGRTKEGHVSRNNKQVLIVFEVVEALGPNEGGIADTQADLLLGEIPVVNLLLPGSDRGLIGAYFEITGPVADPQVRAMPVKSLAEGDRVGAVRLA